MSDFFKYENDLPIITSLPDSDYLRVIYDNGGVLTSARILKSNLGIGGENIHDVNNADYVITDGDGYTGVRIFSMGAIRNINLPLAANNPNRIIKLFHGGLSGGTDYKLNINCTGSDSFENGFDNLSTNIPLMSPGDNMTIKADATRGKWEIISAHSSYRKAFFSYLSTWSDNLGGTFIKREGFDVYLQLECGGVLWGFGTTILDVNVEFASPSQITTTFGTANVSGTVYLIFGGGTGLWDRLQIAIANPGTNSTLGAAIQWRVK